MRRRKLWLLIGIPVVLVVLALGGTWFYFNVIEGKAPAPLSFSARDKATATSTGPASVTPGSLTGVWRPTPASRVNYRIQERAFGQSNTAVGGTNAVTGQLELSETQVTSASFSADMTKVTSDQSRRDAQFQGRIMNTATFPEATFKLTSPIRFETIPADRQETTYQATGDLTLHGTTRQVAFPLKARRNGDNVEINGSIPITFADYNIPNPSFGPISTEDHGQLEFLLVLAHG
jgi:polyisoprenoid-binding protein YceI